MKKNVKYLFLAIALLCSGCVLTSCEGDDNIISQIINGIFNPGQTYYYQGTATSLALDGSTTEQGWMGDYINSNQPSSHSMQVTLKASNTAEVHIPAYTDGKVTVNPITIYNLTMTANSDNTYTELGIGEGSSINGSIVYNGITYNTVNLYITSSRVTADDIALDMTIYFLGDNEGNDPSKAINFTYTGKGITAQ